MGINVIFSTVMKKHIKKTWTSSPRVKVKPCEGPCRPRTPTPRSYLGPLRPRKATAAEPPPPLRSRAHTRAVRGRGAFGHPHQRTFRRADNPPRCTLAGVPACFLSLTSRTASARLLLRRCGGCPICCLPRPRLSLHFSMPV